MSKYYIDAWDLVPFDEIVKAKGIGERVEYLYAVTSSGKAELFVREGVKAEECSIEQDFTESNTEYVKKTGRDPEKFTFVYVYNESPNVHKAGLYPRNPDGSLCWYTISNFDYGHSIKALEPAARRAVDEIVGRFLTLLRRLR